MLLVIMPINIMPPATINTIDMIQLKEGKG